MTDKMRVCLQCRGQTRPGRIEEATGEAKPLALTLRGVPVLECERGHKQFIFAEFPLRVLERLFESEPRLPIARERGMLLFKRLYCSGCGTELSKDVSPEHRAFAAEITLPELPPFAAELSLPVYRCTQCGAEQFRSVDELAGRMPAVLAQAFRAAGIPHG